MTKETKTSDKTFNPQDAAKLLSILPGPFSHSYYKNLDNVLGFNIYCTKTGAVLLTIAEGHNPEFSKSKADAIVGGLNLLIETR